MIDDDYIVFKKSDVEKYMSEREQGELDNLMLLINLNREKDDKTTNVFKELIADIRWD